MSRYIDADALTAEFKRLTLGENSLIERVFADGVYAVIDTFPTADVVEVRHGEWTGMNGDQCSNCGRSLRDLMDGDSYYSSEFEYGGFDALVACPFCGAKMDGERREE